MSLIARIVPVVIGCIIWKKTGNIFIGAFVAFLLEGFIGSLFKSKE